MLARQHDAASTPGRGASDQDAREGLSPDPLIAAVARSKPFLLLPSIDVLAGRVVRLRHGDPSSATVYDDDPRRPAERWSHQGADLLHVVDLDAALGSGENRGVVADVIDVARAAGTSCEVAGGIRSGDDARRWLERGAARVVLGTALVADPARAAGLVAAVGADCVAAAIDVRDGIAVGEGWRRGARGQDAVDLVRTLADLGMRVFEVTAIARDGTMSGPDVLLLGSLRRARPDATLIASGGIRHVADLVALADAGCDGAILGRALYEGMVALPDARRALSA